VRAIANDPVEPWRSARPRASIAACRATVGHPRCFEPQLLPRVER
jgi:hypothetical protein